VRRADGVGLAVMPCHGTPPMQMSVSNFSVAALDAAKHQHELVRLVRVTTHLVRC
jgi:hypothetical protein